MRNEGLRARRRLALACALLLIPAGARAAPAPRLLVVGVADSPPFAIAEEDGSWSGLGVELWRHIADELDLRYELRPTPLEQLGAQLHAGTLDAALGALPVTPAGTALHDYSQPYLSTGLGFAQRARGDLDAGRIAGILLDPRLLTVVAALIAGILLVGALIALVERRQHNTDFAGPLRDSVSTGVWWAAVTMTTVGYGDATPKTPLGRALALVWMFVGVVAVAVFTATVTSILTIAHLRGGIDRVADLQHLRVGAVAASGGGEFLHEHQFAFQDLPDYEAGLRELDAGGIDVFVANRATLRYLVRSDWPGVLQVAPMVLDHEVYAIGLPRNSPLRAAIDESLVRTIHADAWDAVEARYLGRD